MAMTAAEAVLARRAVTNNRNRAYAAFRRDYKLSVGCMDCGYKDHPSALEFDHRPGEIKLFTLNHAATRKHDVVLAEMNKCDVVCANCHRIRTESRKEVV